MIIRETIGVILCLFTGTILGQNTSSQNNDYRIIYAKPEIKNNYNIDLGDIEYGQTETRILRFIISDFDVNQIGRLKRVGCGPCSNIKIADCNSLTNENIYQCKLIANHLPTKKLELEDHKDLFKLLAKDDSILGHIQISYSTVLSKRVCPNEITIDKIIPKKPYSITFRKTELFLVEDIKTDNSQVHIIDWSDNKESFEVNMLAQHTYENKKVEVGLFIYTNPQKHLAIPLTMNIQEFIEIHPRNVFLGVMKAGHEIEKAVDIVSKKKMSVSKCSIDLENCELEINKKSDTEATVHISFKVKDSTPKGPLKGFLKIDTDLTGSSIEIPIYGFVVGKAN